MFALGLDNARQSASHAPEEMKKLCSLAFFVIVGHDKAGQRAKQSDRLDGRDLSACASEDSEAAEHGVSLLRPSVLRMVPCFFFFGAKELR